MSNQITSASVIAVSSAANTALTKATKEALATLNINTGNITTEADGQAALAAAKRKSALAEKKEAPTVEKTETPDKSDEAVKYVKTEAPK